MLRLIGFISGGFEEIVAFPIGEKIADLPDSVPESLLGSRGGFPDQGLELRECEGVNAMGPRERSNDLDRVQVGAVGRQEQEPRASGARARRCPWGSCAVTACPE
nr:hypothetical protein [Paracoccus aerius]